MPPRAAAKKPAAKRAAAKKPAVKDDVKADVVADNAATDNAANVATTNVDTANVATTNNTPLDDMIDDVVGEAAVDDGAAAAADGKDEAEPAEPPRKKPGRPKKRVVTEPIDINGVVEEPTDDENKVEMMYQNPALFKAIFALLKAYAAMEIMIHFKEDTIDFAAQDHLNNTSILATIDCSKLVHYFCREPTCVFIKRNEIETILHNVRKVHERLTFILKTNYTSHIVIQTENSEVGNRNIYEVELCQINKEIVEVFHNETEYPLSFVLPIRHFKEEINSISQLSQRFTIEKSYGEPLSFTFENLKTKTIMNSPYMNPDKIKLQSEIPDDAIFAVSIKIDYIKPFANTKLGETVALYVADDKKIMFKTHLDNGVCTLRVYTSIIKINPEDVM